MAFQWMRVVGFPGAVESPFHNDALRNKNKFFLFSSNFSFGEVFFCLGRADQNHSQCVRKIYVVIAGGNHKCATAQAREFCESLLKGSTGIEPWIVWTCSERNQIDLSPRGTSRVALIDGWKVSERQHEDKERRQQND